VGLGVRLFIFHSSLLHVCFKLILRVSLSPYLSPFPSGIVNMSNLYKNGFPKLATMFLVCMIMWGLNMLASLWLGRFSFQIWRQAGGEEKATAEVNMMAAGVAASGATYAANQQMNQQQMSTV
jgi:hypothetical protein